MYFYNTCNSAVKLQVVLLINDLFIHSVCFKVVSVFIGQVKLVLQSFWSPLGVQFKFAKSIPNLSTWGTPLGSL